MSVFRSHVPMVCLLVPALHRSNVGIGCAGSGCHDGCNHHQVNQAFFRIYIIVYFPNHPNAKLDMFVHIGVTKNTV